MGCGEDGDGKRLGGTDQLVSCCDSGRETSVTPVYVMEKAILYHWSWEWEIWELTLLDTPILQGGISLEYRRY